MSHVVKFRAPKKQVRLIAAAVAGMALLLGGVCYWWFVQRVEVPPDHVLVLVRKVGKTIPAQAGDANFESNVVLYPELLAALGESPDSRKYKGILLDSLPEGRYFYDPFFYMRVVIPAQLVSQNEVGILVRKYGRALPPGKTVATEPDERGPIGEPLRPGKQNLNPYAYELKRVPPVVIPAGHVGVQTLLSGPDPADANSYIVQTGERGVQPDVLPPGMYYNNPYVRRIDVIDARSHTIDLHAQEAIQFPSNDSFDIVLDCTVEYAIRQDQAPYVMVAIGDHEDVKEKLILPYARSLSRIEGSKLFARDFISGEARSAFQQRLFEGLREQCYAQGIEIRATLIRRIVPPAEIADPISDRQIAGQQVMQFENEMKLAEAEARLVEQQEMQRQNQAIGQANREVVALVVEAEQRKAVAITEANRGLQVARLGLEAARQEAQAIQARGEAEAEVVRLHLEAQTAPLRDAVAAFGDGEAYAQFHFYQKLGPALKSVLASTEGPFAEIFRSLAAQRPVSPSEPRALRAGRTLPVEPLSIRGSADVEGAESGGTP